jgi:GTP cyclohydrolase IB
LRHSETFLLPDIQSSVDDRELAIDRAGVRGVRHPITFRTAEGGLIPTVATFVMSVALSPSARGTHMSRFIELVESQLEPMDPMRFGEMVHAMLKRLDASSGAIEMRFPYFVRKVAPISGAASFLDYEVCWRGAISPAGIFSFAMEVRVPVTSLCPCSKEISAYGAHNQRSLITVHAELRGEMPIEELIVIAENCASCELFGLLKRPDEKYVTERAYDNPKFAEDLVRDVALALAEEPRVGAFVVESENFESIHNHSAFARIERAAETIFAWRLGANGTFRGAANAAA